MKKYEESLSSSIKNNIYEITKKLDLISSQVGGYNIAIKAISEKNDGQMNFQHLMIKRLFKIESMLQQLLIYEDEDEGTVEAEEGYDGHGSVLMDKISNERRPYVLNKIDELINNNNRKERIKMMEDFIYSGNFDSDEFAFLSMFINISGELTEKGIAERDKIEELGFEV